MFRSEETPTKQGNINLQDDENAKKIKSEKKYLNYKKMNMN